MNAIGPLLKRVEDIPFVYKGLTGIAVVALVWNSQRNKVNIPTYGGFWSFSTVLASIKLGLAGADPWIQTYANYPMIRIPTIAGWRIIVQPQFLDEIIRAPDDVLSFHETTAELIQTRYTFGDHIVDNEYHHVAIRNQLTRHLAAVLPSVHDEIERALKDTLELKGEEWREVTAFSWVQDIVARASNRIFVGEPLCRDKAWIKLQQEGAGTIMGAALFINLFPEILRPVIGRLISPSARRAKQAAEFLKPIFDERMNMDPAERPADMITWMYECAPEEEHNVVDIASRIVVTNFAAIHTSGMTFTHALLWLVARPEYVPALREEVRAITEKYGWTKDAIAKMVKLDSFMKETMRISPLGPQILSRKVIHPFTFSNGVTIPAGETVSCHLYGVHRDNEIYPDSQEFDGWRFLSMNPGYTGGDPKATAGGAILKGLTDENEEEKGGKETKKTMYTTSRSFLGFGHGRHSCPGRFFAALELKAILASLVLGYDLRWPDDAPKDDGHGRGYRPKDIWFGGNMLPDMKARILIRKRA